MKTVLKWNVLSKDDGLPSSNKEILLLVENDEYPDGKIVEGYCMIYHNRSIEHEWRDKRDRIILDEVKAWTFPTL